MNCIGVISSMYQFAGSSTSDFSVGIAARGRGFIHVVAEQVRRKVNGLDRWHMGQEIGLGVVMG